MNDLAQKAINHIRTSRFQKVSQNHGNNITLPKAISLHYLVMRSSLRFFAV